MAASWSQWLDAFGTDAFAWPLWITQQIEECACSRALSSRTFAPADASGLPRFLETDTSASYSCTTKGSMEADWRAAVAKDYARARSERQREAMTYCIALHWLLEHMPSFDLHFLPPSIVQNGTSMLEDNIAFALMADHAAPWSLQLPLETRLTYILPYASYHESRQNWRPLFFAKFFGLVAKAQTTQEAVELLIAPNAFLNWTGTQWSSSPRARLDSQQYQLSWSSSTSPPVLAPFDFAAYGYASCSGFATTLAYALRAVGVPARQVGTPCWNSVFGGIDYRGLATVNKKVSLCWAGGSAATGHGGKYLNNHNWVEYVAQDTQASVRETNWDFVNVPPTSKVPNTGLCSSFDRNHGCGFNSSAALGAECDDVTGGPAAAMRDHEIFAISWAKVTKSSGSIDGGRVLDASNLTLSSGEHVSPLVWSPNLRNALGQPLADFALRLVNRTDFYRCKPTQAPLATTV